RLIINWTSPTGHTYPRKARRSSPPDAWIRTAGTTIAEQLDLLAAQRSRPVTANLDTPTGTAPDQEPTSPAHSPLEDRLTDALLRHGLANQPRIEYDPDAEPIHDDPPPF
ncbi:MAG TPA: hypothetical protein VIU11_26995, partial [Nakamurella sp.]